LRKGKLLDSRVLSNRVVQTEFNNLERGRSRSTYSWITFETK